MTARREALAVSVQARRELEHANRVLRPPGGTGGRPMSAADWARVMHQAQNAAHAAAELALMARRAAIAAVAEEVDAADTA